MVTQEQKPVIHRHMTIEEILSLFPDKAQQLSQEISNAGLHCVGCHAATWETLEAGMLGHGMVDADINRLVEKLNALLHKKADHTSISMTPSAASKFLAVLAEEGKEGWCLRFSQKKAGCSGFQYVLDYAEMPTDQDAVFESCGVTIVVEKAMLSLLNGSIIDWKEGLQGSGFKIINPNSRSSCGCGNSHSY